MAAWRYEISLLVLKYFSTLEEKFCISAWPCNILANDQQTITAVQSENSSSSCYLYFMYVPYFNKKTTTMCVFNFSLSFQGFCRYLSVE